MELLVIVGVEIVNCLNITAPHLRSQKGLHFRDRDEEGESNKRQRRGTAGNSNK